MDSSKTRLLMVMTGLFGMVGCTVGPDYEPPALEMPAAWTRLEEGLVPSEDVLKNWWTVLDDPVLEGLIEQALDNNLTLQESYLRIQESRALRDAVAGDRYPSVWASGSYIRSRQSRNLPFATEGSDREHGCIRQASMLFGNWICLAASVVRWNRRRHRWKRRLRQTEPCR